MEFLHCHHYHLFSPPPFWEVLFYLPCHLFWVSVGTFWSSTAGRIQELRLGPGRELPPGASFRSDNIGLLPPPTLYHTAILLEILEDTWEVPCMPQILCVSALPGTQIWPTCYLHRDFCRLGYLRFVEHLYHLGARLPVTWCSYRYRYRRLEILPLPACRLPAACHRSASARVEGTTCLPADTVLPASCHSRFIPPPCLF